MSRGGRHLGPKKGTRRKKKEYLRYRKLLREDARANQKEDKRWERLHSEGSSGGSHRGAREEADDLYSDPLYRVGDLAMILKDT